MNPRPRAALTVRRDVAGLHRIRLEGVRDLLPLAATWPDRYPCLLESAAPGARARWDILFALPRGGFALSADGSIRDLEGRGGGRGFLTALDDAWVAARGPVPAAQDAALPFRGGWVLYLGYELAGEIEPRLTLPRSPCGAAPVALALRSCAAILVDRHEGCTWLVAEPGQARILGELEGDLATASPAPASPLPATVHEDDPQRFLDGVARIHEYLLCGDTFQVNFSRAWRASYAHPPAPAGIYAALRGANPAPFSGLLQQAGWALASSSPERLLEVRGGVVQTRPIAGTRPRIAGDDDEARIRELVSHPKECAEHLMLLDLERNDLGRLCRPGSITVDERMVVESYAHVHHIVSNVRGELRDGVLPGQVIAAMFPGGTITGCPKVRCMEIIAELEGESRGAYTGALGYLNLDGDCDLNILIRTLSIEGAAVEFRAGAGIVADSMAEAELGETRAKARGLLRALGMPA